MTEAKNAVSVAMQGFGLGAVLGQAWSALLGVTDRLTDVVYDYVPENVSRSTVRLFLGPTA